MIETEVRRGAYYDSVVLMQLQRALARLPGVLDAGVVMGVQANKDLLAQSGLLTREAGSASADDLIVVVQADEREAALGAIGQVDALLSRRSSADEQPDYRPKSLATALNMAPDARWVLVSVPGRYAAGVAREALQAGKNVFLYSDNVSVDDEVALKQAAAQSGLLIMGPDCGTAIINGVGLGFANRVRRGPIGVVGASGTGLQQVTAQIHHLGSGITHALGTGGRDLSEAVDAITARQAFDLLIRDPYTAVLVLISKPPSAAVAKELLQMARVAAKPVVVDFIGYSPYDTGRADWGEQVYFARTLDGAARLAVKLAAETPEAGAQKPELPPFAPSQRYLRGLFSGGTLAYEAMLILQDTLPNVYSNAPLDKRFKLAQSTLSQRHTVVDLGEDEFTVGRLHPMLDHELRVRRLAARGGRPRNCGHFAGRCARGRCT